jgi:hypothetical protein
MARIRSKASAVSNTGNIFMGIALPVEAVAAIDEWAKTTGHLKPNGTVNRSGAIRTLVSMWLSDGDMLNAAIKAKNIGLVGIVGETARVAYKEAHERVCEAIDNL